MADFVKGLFGGQQKVAQPHSGGDDGTPAPAVRLARAATRGPGWWHTSMNA
jgi:hypothetical protein